MMLTRDDDTEATDDTRGYDTDQTMILARDCDTGYQVWYWLETDTD